MLLRTDGAGIYTLSNQPGTVIQGNLIHDAVGSRGGIYLDEGSGFIEVTSNVVYNVVIPIFFNNQAQGRIDTCNSHDNHVGARPGDPNYPADLAASAGLEEPYRDLLLP